MDLADKAIELCHELALRRVEWEIESRLRTAYKTDPAAAHQLDPQAQGEDDFVRRHIAEARTRAIIQLPPFERYTLLAADSAVQFDSPDLDVKQLPKDIHTVSIKADGPNGSFIDIHLQSKFRDFNDVRNWQLNQIVIHGDDADWVNSTHEKLRALLGSQCLKTRAFVYSNCLTIFWFSLLLLLFAEYRVTRWLYPTFSLQAPLSGTGALVMFGVLAATVIIFGNTVIPIYSHWFPYFEVEQNLTRSRIASRKLVTGIITALFTGGTINLILTIFGPALKRLFP